MRIDTSLDRLFLGYRRISFCREDMGKVVAALLRSGLGAAIDDGSSISVPLRRVKRYCNALSEIDISVGEICGLPGAIGALTARRWLLAGILISTLFYLFSFSFVWDVRISGNEEYSDSDVLSELETVGLYSGASWYSLSRDEVENRLLETSDNIGWINVNRRGAVAYVRVREKHLPSDVIDAGGYSNIVASEACVIEQITVRSGVAAVEVGDTVKAGDILISGIVSTPDGDIAVRASGEVRGRVIRENSVFVSRSEALECHAEPQLVRADAKFFNFSLNIFKKYRKSTDGYVIIEDMKECILPGGYKIPLALVLTYESETHLNEVSYTDSELISIGKARLDAIRVEQLQSCDLLRISTSGKIRDDGYEVSTVAVAVTSVARELFFYNNGAPIAGSE